MQRVSDVLDQIMSGKSSATRRTMKPLRADYTVDFLNAEWARICPVSFQDFDIDLWPNQPEIFQTLMAIDLSYQGALIHGVSRTGKTRIASQMLKNAHYRGFVCLWVDSEEFATKCVQAHRGDNEGHFYREMVSPQILLLDDLGKSKLTQRVTEGLFQVIDKRSRSLKTTVLTTNETGGSLANRCEDKELAEAAIRRLKEFCRIINL